MARVLELGRDGHGERGRFWLAVWWARRWGTRGRNGNGDRWLTRCSTWIFVVFTFFTFFALCMFVRSHRRQIATLEHAGNRESL
jgi:hypothetical protein